MFELNHAYVIKAIAPNNRPVEFTAGSFDLAQKIADDLKSSAYRQTHIFANPDVICAKPPARREMVRA